MKGLPCPALPHCWQLGSCFMAEGSGTQAPGKEPPLSIQVLRARYEGLRRQQRAQAHLVVLPKGRAGRCWGQKWREEGLAVGVMGGGPWPGQSWALWGLLVGKSGEAGRARARARRPALGSSAWLSSPPGASAGHLASCLLYLASALLFSLCQTVLPAGWWLSLLLGQVGGDGSSSWLGLTSCKAEKLAPERADVVLLTARAQARGSAGSRTQEAPWLGEIAYHCLKQLPRRHETQKPQRENASSLWELRFHSWRKLGALGFVQVLPSNRGMNGSGRWEGQGCA